MLTETRDALINGNTRGLQMPLARTLLIYPGPPITHTYWRRPFSFLVFLADAYLPRAS